MKKTNKKYNTNRYTSRYNWGGRRKYQAGGIPPNFDNMTFKEAFAAARQQGMAEFMWRDKPYHTEMAKEVPAQQGDNLITVTKTGSRQQYPYRFRPGYDEASPKTMLQYEKFRGGGMKKMYQFGGGMYSENVPPAGMGSTSMTVYQESDPNIQRQVEERLADEEGRIRKESAMLSRDLETDRSMDEAAIAAAEQTGQAEVQAGVQGVSKLAKLFAKDPSKLAEQGLRAAGTGAALQLAPRLATTLAPGGQMVSTALTGATKFGGQGVGLGQAFSGAKQAFQMQKAINAARTGVDLMASPALGAGEAGLSALGKGLGSFAKSGAGIGTIASLAGMGVSKLADDDDPTKLNFGEGAGATLSGIGTGIGAAAGTAALMGSSLGPLGTLAGGIGGAIYGLGSSLIGRKKAREEEAKRQQERQEQVDEYNEELGENYASQMARYRAMQKDRKVYSGYNLGRNVAAQLGGLRMAMPRY